MNSQQVDPEINQKGDQSVSHVLSFNWQFSNYGQFAASVGHPKA